MLFSTLFQDGVGYVSYVGVDPFQIAKNIEVDGARVNRLPESLVKSVDMGLSKAQSSGWYLRRS